MILGFLNPHRFRPRLYNVAVILIATLTLAIASLFLVIIFFGRHVLIGIITTDEELAQLLGGSWWPLYLALFVVSISMVFRAVLLSRRHFATLLLSTTVSFALCELPWMLFSHFEGKDIRFLGLSLVLPWAISLVGCVIRIFLMPAPPHLLAPLKDETDRVEVVEANQYGSYPAQRMYILAFI